jgi:hypothetical protein
VPARGKRRGELLVLAGEVLVQEKDVRGLHRPLPDLRGFAPPEGGQTTL